MAVNKSISDTISEIIEDYCDVGPITARRVAEDIMILFTRGEDGHERNCRENVIPLAEDDQT